MTDKELLEAAAKAEGIKGAYRTEAVLIAGDWFDVTAIFYDDGSGWWNPLADDGDAFRLLETRDLAVWARGFAGGLRRVKTKDGPKGTRVCGLSSGNSTIPAATGFRSM